jgi:hypothetical protein
MAAGPKKASKRRDPRMTGRRLASAKPPSPSTTASPSRRRKTQAPSGARAKETTSKPARERSMPRGKAAGVRRGGEMDSALAARLETIGQGLGQIGDMRAELANLRAVIEALVQTVSALTGDSQAQRRGGAQSAAGTSEALIIESHDAFAAEEEKPEPQRAAQG